MKFRNCLYCTLLAVLFVSFTACEKENEMEELTAEIPVAIKRDFNAKYPLATITSFHAYSDSLNEIEFVNDQQNKASVWYDKNVWKFTYTKVDDLKQLPVKVQDSFRNSPYANATVLDIYKAERRGIKQPLYTLHFKYAIRKTPNVEHYVFISEDGLFIKTFTWQLNDPSWIIRLPQDHFNYIARKYSGAEIRGYVNNGGYNEYFILHEGKVKFVTFRGEKESDNGFWYETRYELGRDVVIPDNVISMLHKINPDFTYTHVYYIESPDGNSYLLQDKNHDQELGYYIGEGM